MRIHRLGFGALGPFAGEHSVDFDGLGGSALFLIDGPTGAGKSTIIDAIVFALFGDVAGSGSDRQRLRSSFSGPADESYAELDFSTSFGRYRVRRTPEYERAKVRGAGTTRAPASVVLLRSTGPEGWEPVSTRQAEADAEIARIVGLNRAQFLQTVVLPQGEFATFLAAESKDRQAVLERIFATSLYSRIEAELEEGRRAAQAAREESAAVVERAIQHVRSRLSDEELAALGPEVDAHEDADAVAGALRGMLDAVTVRLGDENASLDDRVRDLESALHRLHAVETRAEARLRLASAEERVAAARLARDGARARLQHHSATLELLGADMSDPDGQIAAVDRVTGSLEAAIQAERRLILDAEERERLRAAALRIDAQIALLESERDHDLPLRMLVLSVALHESLEAAVEAAALASAREVALVQARLDGMAAELASGLVDGVPCSVCGSAHHPDPATPSGEMVTPADLTEASRGRATADDQRHSLQREQARLETVAADLGPATTGDRPSPAAPADIAAGVRDLQDRISTVGRSLRSAGDERSSVAAELTAITAFMDERTAVVSAALGGHPSISDRVAALADARLALVTAVEADEEVARRERARQEAVDALATLGADRADDDALLPDLQRECGLLDAQVRTASSRRDSTEALLTDLRSRADQAVASAQARERCWRDTAEVISLGNVVKGGAGNALAQPLSSYVVQTMFDEVLVSANRRLRTMLDGRFELQSTEGRTGRRLMGLGLGLQVLDLRTESVRRTSTMSGGETFCASLALALGLADTVRAHAGGVEIGILLIDEGFGSLDGDRLDEVMAELLRLRADGRTVGVISHVAEMKRSIPERIDVRPLGARLGSTLEVSWTD